MKMGERSTPRDSPEAYRLRVDEAVAVWNTDAERGLSDAEARRRLASNGKNELAAEPAVPAWKQFLAQFRDVLVLLLLVATLISAGLWWYEGQSELPYEAIAIFAVVLLNALVGYLQQSRAERAVAALRRMAAAQAHVIREGTSQRIAAADLVPGDLLLVTEGDTIPADARLLHSTALQTAEAPLTGESLPIAKHTAPIPESVTVGDRRNMLFSGTVATYGHGRAVVTATGMQTELGRIAHLLKQAPADPTPLQQELNRLGRLLGVVVIIIAAVMIGTILLVEQVRGIPALLDVLILGIALAVAAVPEGLPAVVTAVLSVGVQRMARRHAIVRRLAAVETLGSATVIASDKTGTLTKNEMTVRTLVTASGRVTFTGTGYAPEGEMRIDGEQAADGALAVELDRALAAADRANNAALHYRDGRWTAQGDPTEVALIVAARKAGLTKETLDARFSRLAEIPFSSERQLMSTVYRDARRPTEMLTFTKGAPDVVLTRCPYELVGHDATPLTAERRAAIVKVNEELAGEALRTLGLAFRSLPRNGFDVQQADPRVEEDLVFLGLIGMMDPPREEAKDAVSRARQAGIRVIMITGDHPGTATVIARELGILSQGEAVTGAELAGMTDDALDRASQRTSVYARVHPEHKLRIVKALQRQGATVAMTGDGVNDAPALKTADIGIAMGKSGTDVSREAADMVLADDNFATVVAAVEEGRAIFSNIRKFLRYLLSSNFGEVMTVFFGVVLADTIGLSPDAGNDLLLPLVATQILWINLVTDGAPALALGLDPADAGLMAKPPRPRTERVITRSMWGGIIFVGAIMAVGTLLILDACLPGGLIEGSGTLRYARTMAFTTLVFFQLFTVFNARSDEHSAFVGLFANRWLWGAVCLSLVLQVAVIYVPVLQQAFSTVGLSAVDWLTCAAVASSVLWLREGSKYVTAFFPIEHPSSDRCC